MSFIPDCRTHEIYNEDNLNGSNKVFLQGFDWAVQMVDNMFANLDMYPEAERLLDDNVAIIQDGKADVIREAIADWAEAERNDLIVTMIEGQGDV